MHALLLDDVASYLRHAAAAGSTTDLRLLLEQWRDYPHLINEADAQVRGTHRVRDTKRETQRCKE